MCLILFSLDRNDHKLVILANRDEFYERPALQAHFWEDHPEILAGRDLTAGGTWMGVNKRGKIAMLTNYRDLRNIDPNAPSRGQLVSDFLTEGSSGEEYLHAIPDKGKAYNGYNLIAGTSGDFYYQSNYAEGVHRVKPGIHGLSNALLDTSWPKVDEGKRKLAELLDSGANPDELLDAVYDDHYYADDRLPDTGVGIEKERMLSSMFIKSPNYGSRCTTLIRVNRHNELEFIERTYDPGNFSYRTVSYQFTIEDQVPE